MIYNPVKLQVFNPDALGVRPIFEFIGGRTINQAALSPVIMNIGDSNVVKGMPPGGRAFITDLGVLSKASGKIQIKSQSMHDTNNGIPLRHTLAQPYPLWPIGIMQEVVSQELLDIQLSGGAGAGTFDLFGLEMMYTSLGGNRGTVINERELRHYFRKYTATEHSIVGGAGGGYTGEELLTAGDIMNLKANTYYALIGVEASINCFVTLKGPDTGGLRRGILANAANKAVSRSYPIDKCRAWQDEIPYITVINASNVGNTYVAVMVDESAPAPIVTLYWAELRSTLNP